MKTILMLCSALAIAVTGQTIAAMERLDGVFIARQSCPAFQSKNKRSNPGNITLVPGTSYAMRGTNPPTRDWYQISVPQAPATEARWVPVTCGTYQSAEPPTETAAPMQMALALSWQPAFCEARPNLTECRRLNSGRMPQAARQLSLHGLWPQPRNREYCGVSPSDVALDKAGRWSDLPDPGVDDETRDRLAVAMPGSASHLDRHEWIKHGTCYGTPDGDDYYDDTLALLDAITGSAVGRLFETRRADQLSAAAISQAFDAAFGAGAGQRVEIICSRDGGRILIREIRINLAGTITARPDLSTLILAAPPRDQSCKGGVLDPAGLQ